MADPNTTIKDDAAVPACTVINRTGLPLVVQAGSYYAVSSLIFSRLGLLWGVERYTILDGNRRGKRISRQISSLATTAALPLLFKVKMLS